ncbi:MAG: ammonium transporter [Methyloceanibacter sp.]
MGDNLSALTTIFTEFYYWVTVVIMFLIHVGFCMYEVGVSRHRNHLHTLMKNTMLIPLVTITFFFFGWWIYWAFPNGPFIYEGKGLILEGATGANQYLPWSPKMGPNLQDHITGVFWAAFLLFSWTVASIVSGSLIERIKSGAFWVIAVMIGSVTWIIDAAWGWHFDGWMVKLLGYHDAYASGVIHAIGGGTALGVLVVLGPRLGRFAADGTPREFVPHNQWLVTVGLFLIYTGFWGFYAACNVPIISPELIAGQVTGSTWTATTIYLTPTTLSAITFNFLMSLSGGLMVAYIISKGNPFWTYSGGLAGVITASAGNDLYHPIQAFFVGGLGIYLAYYLHYWVERRFKIDDAVGAVAVHGYCGFIGLVFAGFILWGYPSSPYEGYATVSPLGNTIGAVIMFFVLGFLPGWAMATILNSFGLLRVPRQVELMGLDFRSLHDEEVAREEVIRFEKAMA